MGWDKEGRETLTTSEIQKKLPKVVRAMKKYLGFVPGINSFESILERTERIDSPASDVYY